MKPLFLSPAEVNQALETGEVTLERVMEPQPDDKHFVGPCGYVASNWSLWGYGEIPSNWGPNHSGCRCKEVKSPFGSTGQEFWVRENYHPITPVELLAQGKLKQYWYQADSENSINVKWCKASTMPQEASRLTLITKETKAENRDGVWVWVGKLEVKG